MPMIPEVSFELTLSAIDRLQKRYDSLGNAAESLGILVAMKVEIQGMLRAIDRHVEVLALGVACETIDLEGDTTNDS